MIAKKRVSKKANLKAVRERSVEMDWRQSLLKRLAKLQEIDGIFVVEDGSTIHVFSVFAVHDSKVYKRLLKQEDLVEKDHPDLSFDFHGREHQGRLPHRAVPYGAEQVFLR